MYPRTLPRYVLVLLLIQWVSSLAAAQCSQGEVQCYDGACIDENYWCDGQFEDCPDGLDEDEQECADYWADDGNCTENEFQCWNGTCINITWQCDGEIEDCLEGEDEADCEGFYNSTAPSYNQTSANATTATNVTTPLLTVLNVTTSSPVTSNSTATRVRLGVFLTMCLGWSILATLFLQTT